MSYFILKEHFDNLLKGRFPRSTGMEPIRDTYEESFGMNINLLDVYQTNVSIKNNPMHGIITLVGPEKEDTIIPTGFISTRNSDVFYINHLTEDIFMQNTDNEKYYINSVFNTIRDIIKRDRFYEPSEELARKNPHCVLLYVYPFYLTFHHIAHTWPEALKEKYFYNILESWYTDITRDSEYNKSIIDKCLESIYQSKYTTNPNQVYSIMTCNNTIEII